MSWKLCFERKGAFLVQLHRSGSHYRVRYGFQEWDGTYENAAKHLGEALMHCLSCEGALDGPDDVETGE